MKRALICLLLAIAAGAAIAQAGAPGTPAGKKPAAQAAKKPMTAAEKAEAAKLAAYYTTVIHGLSIQALDGASAEELQSIVDCAMASWDTLVR